MKKEVFALGIFLFFACSLASVSAALQTENASAAANSSEALQPGAQIIANVLFGSKGKEILFSQFVVMMALLIIFVALLRQILEALPFFDSPAKAWAGAVLIALIIGVSGGIKDVTFFLFAFFANAPLLKDSFLLQFLFIIFVGALLFFGIFSLLNIIKNKAKIEDNEQIGFKTSIEPYMHRRYEN